MVTTRTMVCIWCTFTAVLVFIAVQSIYYVPAMFRKAPYQIPNVRRLAHAVEKNCDVMVGENFDQDTFKSPIVLNQILVSDEYRFMFCFVPKVASSNIKRVFEVLQGLINNKDTARISKEEVKAHELEIKRLSSFSQQGRQYRLRHYTKAMVMREPFERLVSAYRNKIEHGVSINETVSVQINAHVLRVLNAGTENKLTVVTFADFIRFYVEQSDVKAHLDCHFATHIDLCDPCRIGYDLIATYDNIDAELEMILKDVGADNAVNFPRREAFYKSKVKTRELLSQYYNTVPPTLMRRLQLHLSKDARFFDMETPAEILKLLDKSSS